MKCVKGSISVVLALTVTMILSFCMVLIESARENTMLLKSDVIFDTGIQCLLAEYHAGLWEDFDLLYVDASYGTGLPDYELVKTHTYNYVNKNLSFDNYGWLALEYRGAQMSEVLLATDNSGADFYAQAVEAAAESIGVTYIEQVLRWLQQVESTDYLEATINSEISKADRQIEDADGSVVEVKEAVWGVDEDGEPILLEEAEYETVDIDNPLDNIFEGNILVRQVLGETTEISDCRIDTDSLASKRTLASGSVSESSTEGSTADSGDLWNKALFCKYVIEHFASYTDDGDFGQKALRYPLEYVIGGRAGDAANLEVVMAKLLLIREIDNYLFLLQDEIRMVEAEAIGTAVATTAYVPWLAPVIKHAMLLYWAYEDSVADLRQLFQGGEVPLVKALRFESVSDFSLNYEEYLMILLLLQGRETLVMRSMDMIEASMRQEQSDFCMDGCISSAVLAGTFLDRYDKQYTVTKKLQYY